SPFLGRGRSNRDEQQREQARQPTVHICSSCPGCPARWTVAVNSGSPKQQLRLNANNKLLCKQASPWIRSIDNTVCQTCNAVVTPRAMDSFVEMRSRRGFDRSSSIGTFDLPGWRPYRSLCPCHP